MAGKTIGDYIAKENSKLSFEERCAKFKEKIRPICEELGVIPWSKLVYTEELIASSPNLKDLWDSGKE